MKRLVIGMTAHVDSGKTTLSEGLLFIAGQIRKLGRVDHGDAFLDTHSIERERGITVFSKQAVLRYNDNEYTLLDTPGHVDFSAEAERAISALDYAVLVISGTDGVQSHTTTLWRVLAKNRIPTFIFVNKMDISAHEKVALMGRLSYALSGGCIDFSDTQSDEFFEQIATQDEDMMNYYLENGTLDDRDIINAISKRKVFPCFFGSALKLKGVEELLKGIDRFTREISDSGEFGARVFKITDEQGVRLTHIKITSGSLKVKSVIGEEKVNQIRIYSGSKFTATDEAFAGSLCALTGLTTTFAGQGLGNLEGDILPILEPVLTYRLILPPDADIHTVLTYMRKLEEEDPQLNVFYSEQLKEIHLKLMGEIQLEILIKVIKERFSLDVAFDTGSIAYKETIKDKVIGVGHYEPLKHYAEVQLLLEPRAVGSGLKFATEVSEDKLDRNWQRLILTHLEEKTHLGVLTGSPITDMKITLVAGKAHLKHTEGGDFRQATYRAVRQGLRKAQSVLLEPWYDFTLTIPAENVGRAMTDLQRLSADFESPLIENDIALITGAAPVYSLRGYHTEVLSYTKGQGVLNCFLKGYYPCHNEDEVISQIGYDCDADLDNSADSVFCSHGAGFVVRWDEVDSHKHTDSGIRFGNEPEEKEKTADFVHKANQFKALLASDDELMEIFEKTYGKIKRAPIAAMRTPKSVEAKYKSKDIKKGPEYLLVDGYNIIFSWEDLKAVAKDNLDLARQMLINRLCNYQGFMQMNLILVFDAYRVKGQHREIERVHNIDVVYTKEAETADMYIEKVSHKLSKDCRVKVATSDGLEQIIILGAGALRVSAREFLEEVKRVEKAIDELIN